MALIALGSRGLVVKVDEADLLLVAQYRWYRARPRHTDYALAKANGKTIYMHRLILGLERGDRRSVDHADRDGLNNQRSNLRIADPRTQSHNAGKHTSSKVTSRFKGVSLQRLAKKWQVQIYLAERKPNGRNRVLSALYVNEEDAARQYDKWAIEHFGEFALTNEKLGLLGTRSVVD